MKGSGSEYWERTGGRTGWGHYLKEKGPGAGGEGGGVMGESGGDPGRYFGGVEAGGAYVPLVPGIRKDALRYHVEDARCRVVVTETGGSGASWGRGAGDSADGLGEEREAIERESGEKFGGRENRREFCLCDLYVGIGPGSQKEWGSEQPAVW